MLVNIFQLYVGRNLGSQNSQKSTKFWEFGKLYKTLISDDLWCQGVNELKLNQGKITKENSDREHFNTERPSDRNTIWPNTVRPIAIWPKVHSTESPFDRKFILPKGHMTDFFQKIVIWPNLLSTKKSFNRKQNCVQGRMTKNSFDRKFIWPKVFFLKIII
jgi:hypothetical protein